MYYSLILLSLGLFLQSCAILPKVEYLSDEEVKDITHCKVSLSQAKKNLVMAGFSIKSSDDEVLVTDFRQEYTRHIGLNDGFEQKFIRVSIVTVDEDIQKSAQGDQDTPKKEQSSAKKEQSFAKNEQSSAKNEQGSAKREQTIQWTLRTKYRSIILPRFLNRHRFSLFNLPVPTEREYGPTYTKSARRELLETKAIICQS